MQGRGVYQISNTSFGFHYEASLKDFTNTIQKMKFPS